VSYLADVKTNVSSRAFAGRSPQRLGVLSFEGTEYIDQWIEDLTLELVPWAGCVGCHVHLGFSEAWLLLSDSVERKLTSLAPLSSLLIVGHSLGGAEASLAAFDLALAGFPLSAVYTAGAPRVGDGAFASAFNGFLASSGSLSSRGLNVLAVEELRLSPVLARAASGACLHADNAGLFADASEAAALAAALTEIGALSVERAAGRLRRAPPALSPRRRAVLGQLALPSSRAFAGAAVYRLVHFADIVPHLPPEAWGYTHHVSEVWFNEQASVWRACSNRTGEDPTCSDQLPASSLTVSDHSEYLNFSMTKSC